MENLSEMLDQTVVVVLAGGVGSRLSPLTTDRAKPAVPFGGKYRIIDFTLANCLHSGLRRVLVLTQYKSHSLQKHLRDAWSVFNPELGEYITPIPPQMRHGEQWYRGTADAIFQNLYLLERSGARWVLILSGDHIYRMDYAAMLESHLQAQADLCIAGMEVDLEEARSFGVMIIDSQNRLLGFEEKPDQPKSVPGNSAKAMASMGVYLFSMDFLLDALKQDGERSESSHDFGKDIIPWVYQNSKVVVHQFGEQRGRVSPDRYWRDVGTIDAYYEANMDLLKPVPPLNLYQKDWPIRTYQGQYPPARTVPGNSGNEGIFINSMLAGGVVISGGSVQDSVLFPCVQIGDESFVEKSILFNDVQVGEKVRLRNCIVDKQVVIPDRTVIGYDREQDEKRFTVSEKGIIVVPKNAQF